MNIFRVIIVTTVATLAFSLTAKAEQQTSDWFVGAGVSSDFYSEDNAGTGDSNTDGFELHAGYQINEYLKIITGYKKFGTSQIDVSESGSLSCFMSECTGSFSREDNLDLNSLFIKIRPEWKFANNFKLFADLALNSLDFDFSSRVESNDSFFSESSFEREKQTSTKFSWGFGIGYNLGRHELTVSFENYGTLKDANGQDLLVDSSVLSSLSLQYYFHF